MNFQITFKNGRYKKQLKSLNLIIELYFYLLSGKLNSSVKYIKKK